MPKKSTLLDEIAGLPDAPKRGHVAWDARLHAIEPAYHAEVMALIEAHQSHDAKLRRKFATEAQLADWLAAKITAKGVQVSETTMREYFRKRRVARNVAG